MITKVALIEPPSKFIVMRDMYSSTISKLGYCWPNVDLLSISGQLRENFNCRIFDFSSSKVQYQKSIKQLSLFKPSHIIFAYGESTGIFDLHFIREVKKIVLPKYGKILGSGGSMIHNPTKFMEDNKWLDGIIMNYTFSSLSDYLKGEIKVINLVVKEKRNDSYKYEKIDPPPNYEIPPGLHEDLNFSSYYLPQFGGENFTSIATSWGCPYQCSFCVSSRLSFRMRSPDSIFEEIEYCKKLGINTFFFRDNVFGINKSHLKKLSNLIVKSGKKINFMSDTRLDLISDEVISYINKMGNASLNFGIESKNNKTLSFFLKNTKVSDAQNIIDKCKKNKIITTGYFILGLEGETEEDVNSTIEYAKKIPLNYASFNLPIPIEGTKMRDDAIKRKIIKEDSYNYDGLGMSIVPNNMIYTEKLKELQFKAYNKFYLRISIISRIIFMNISIKSFKKLFSAFLLLKKWKKV